MYFKFTKDYTYIKEYTKDFTSLRIPVISGIHESKPALADASPEVSNSDAIVIGSESFIEVTCSMSIIQQV